MIDAVAVREGERARQADPSPHPGGSCTSRPFSRSNVSRSDLPRTVREGTWHGGSPRRETHHFNPQATKEPRQRGQASAVITERRTAAAS